MGKIRVSSLANKMGIPNQDLLFKLQSIGVRLEGDDPEIDTDIIQAILTGKNMAQPREVILRDGETQPAPTRRTPPRRMPQSPVRPRGRRTMIQRVDSRIKTLPSSKPETPAEPTPPTEEKEAPTAETAAAATLESETASAEKEARAPVGRAPVGKAPVGKAPVGKAPAGRAPAGRAAPTSRPASRPAGRPASRPAEKPAQRGPAGARGLGPRPTQRRPPEIGRTRRPRRPSVSDTAVQTRTGSYAPTAEPERERVESAPLSNRGRRRADRRGKGEVPEETVVRGDRPEGSITISEGMTLRVFAERLGVKSKDLIQRLMKDGVMATVNQIIEPELATQLAEDMGIEAVVVSFEEEIQEQEALVTNEENLATRAPVVTVMGHVDHGKTSLLDKIRSSQVAEGEAGGITQHIAAYHVDIDGRPIVFLDTPGHEAFTKLRARGAQVTDIVILMVAADDGVMAQTQEAIDHARGGEVPILVAINKIDKANANQDKVKQELSDAGLIPEEWGGDTIAVPVSALKGDGIDQLLEMVLLQADVLELRADPTVSAQGVVIEARKEKGRGNVATVLVQAGTLHQGDVVVAGSAWGKVRAMSDDRAERVEECGPSSAVEITGFGDLPAAGDTIQVVDHESKARSIVAFRQEEERQKELAPSTGRLSLEDLFSRIEEGSAEELPLVVKADVQGSLEVLKDTLEDLSTPKVKVRILLSGVGAISTNDISFAAASGAIAIGFNVRPEKAATELAAKEGVDIRLHTVIYELIEELQLAMTGLLKPTIEEVDMGRAEVRETFKVPRIGTIAGCHVVEGTINRSSMARLLRDNVVVYQGKIASLRRFKDDASEVRTGFDCGIGLDRFQDVKPGDFIEVYEKQEVAATL